MTYDIDKITVGSPHPTVDPIINMPTYQTIQELHLKLNANAVSIYTNLGGGNHSFLRLTVSEAQYNSVSLIPFVAPTHPSAIPIYSLNATATRMGKGERSVCHFN